MVFSIIRQIPDDKFKDIIKNSNNYSDAMRNCDMNNVGNYSTIKKRIEELGLDITHFDSNKYPRIKLTNEKIFIIGSKFHRQALKKRLLNDMGYEYKCNSCGISEWKNRKGELQKISLELEHINGINNDNRLENLELLCPNCHSMTDTFRAKNKSYEEKDKKQCIDCKVEVLKTSTRCNFCKNKERVKKAVENGRPTLEQLEKDVKETSYVQTGRKYNVSDNCIRKWIDNYKKYELIN